MLNTFAQRKKQSPQSGLWETVMYGIYPTFVFYVHKALDLLKHGYLVIQVSTERTMSIYALTHQIEGTIQTIID